MQARGRSLWLQYAYFAIIVLLALVAISIYALYVYQDFFLNHLRESLKIHSQLTISRLREFEASKSNSISSASSAVKPSLTPSLTPSLFSSSLNVYCKDLGKIARTRITIILPSGEVICESHASLNQLENHLTRPEVSKALQGKETSLVRVSNTLHERVLYYSVPLYSKREIIAVVRTAYPLTEFNSHLREIFLRVIAIALFITLTISLMSYYLYLRVSSPLHEMREGAIRFAQGHFDKKLPQYELKEISQLSTAMNMMGAQLNRLEKVRRDFVANVSHELKTPITSIKGFVETLLDGAANDVQDRDRFLRIIGKHSERLTSIIEDLLILARLESDQIQELLLFQEENLKSVLGVVAEMCRGEAEKKNISISLMCNPDIVAVIDRSLIEQAVMNLVDNAVKYSESGREVRLEGEVLGEKVAIHVYDQGPGIPEEHLPRLFERFYRVDKARSRKLGGTGLGLAIVKHVANVHSGTIEVESVVGEGSVFTLSLPAARKEAGN